MPVISGALLRKFSRNALAVCQHTSGLKHWPHWRTNSFSSGDHSELAHVRLDLHDVGVRLDLGDALELTAARQPWVLVQEISSVLSLMFIFFSAELDVSLGLA